MKIAIDLSTLQTGHRMRGIGAVLINFINHLPKEAKNNHEYIFFLNPGDDNDVLKLLKLKDVKYSIEYLKPLHTVNLHLPGRLNVVAKIISKSIGLLEFYRGDGRISKTQLSGIDSYLQFDQSQKLPAFSKEHATLILYDIIPYVMESDYLWSYPTARRNGRTRRSALKCAFHRHQYLAKLKISCQRAKSLIAISEYTKSDFVKHVGVNESKISVCLLGADSTPTDIKFTPKDSRFSAYKTTSWGSVPQDVDLSQKPFLLFMGGADPRRKLVELMAAYNNLRARGHDISLVLAGDTMYGSEKVPHAELQQYLKKNSSYINDVQFLGFVTDEQKGWLYKHALVYIYPSVYEGFGLPVLEAMQYGTPVVTYKNSSIAEISADTVMYAKNFTDIVSSTELLINDNNIRESYKARGEKRSSSFTWAKTSSRIIDLVS